MSMALGRLFGWVPSLGELRERLMGWRLPGHWKDDYRNGIIMIAACAPLVYSRIWYSGSANMSDEIVAAFRLLPWLPPIIGTTNVQRWGASSLSLVGVAIIVAAIAYIGGGRRFRHFVRGTTLAIGSMPLVGGQIALVAGLLLAFFQWQQLVLRYPYPLPLIVYGAAAWAFGEAWLRLTSDEFEYVPDHDDVHPDGDPACPECARLRKVLNRSEELLQGLQSENAQLRRRLEE